MTYNSTAKAFRDASSNSVFLFVEKDANDKAQWFQATNTDGSTRPRGDIPQLTADVILNGTYNTQTEAISYNGSNYKIRLERDTGGVHIAKAYTV